MDSLALVVEYTVDAGQRRTLRHQAEMVMRAAEESIPEADDLAAVAARYMRLAETAAALDSGVGAQRSWPAPERQRRPGRLGLNG